MKITLVHGSPKKENKSSATRLIIDYLAEQLAGHEVHRANANSRLSFPMDVIVFVFPLYVDGIPSHLLKALQSWQDLFIAYHIKTKVYVVVNNGFYEPGQNYPAIAMMKQWCKHAGLLWGKAVAVGGGGSITAAAIGKGPNKNLADALDQLALEITEGGVMLEDDYVKSNLSRGLYRLSAHLVFRLRGRHYHAKLKQQ
ncbi:MAG: NAD(P)H-dependent oxidoreductase [Erysipelotrichaceae bacterium]|jgi:multimeric flavodoxin WrbA|nr:NAD(P)H-dependent oxidoreductase [Erysipelotrichaceae bacterium]